MKVLYCEKLLRNHAYVIGVIQDYSKSFCCDGKIVDYNGNGNLSCCGWNSLYDMRTQICCYGKLYPRGKSSSLKCCRDKPMNYTSQKCCNGKIIPKDRGLCCYGKSYLTDGRTTLGCCGKTMYDSTKEICCNQKVEGFQNFFHQNSISFDSLLIVPTMCVLCSIYLLVKKL